MTYNTYEPCQYFITVVHSVLFIALSELIVWLVKSTYLSVSVCVLTREAQIITATPGDL